MTRRVTFIDGNLNVAGCVCSNACEFPCWQREGIAPPCSECGCEKPVRQREAANVKAARRAHEDAADRLAETKRTLDERWPA